ncbi:MAG TPA: FAD-dependent monooxygenase, partial [Acetobacteraceae bacterium]|nr:FAD-dependent monooxygenase [Acetobacteraceae bacterium]
MKRFGMVPARRIAVIGVGIGGLTSALALHAAGFGVAVYERAARLAEEGAGLQVTPNAGRVLVHLGLGPALAACGEEAGEQTFHHFRTGHVLRRVDLGGVAGRFGVPHYRMHRADLQALLAEALATRAPDALRLGHRLERVVQRRSEVRLVFADGGEETADLVVGADGIRSALRDELFPEGGRARFTGYVSLRALVPMAKLPEPLRTARVHFGGGRFLTQYPIRRGALMNVSAAYCTDSWTEEGWRIRARSGEMREAFADFNDDVRALLACVSDDTAFRWGLFGREPLRRWVHGRVVLLGDAAHPMLPYMAQGAAMAIEDAMVLARALSASGGHAEEALVRYEAARLPRANWVAGLTRTMGAI